MHQSCGYDVLVVFGYLCCAKDRCFFGRNHLQLDQKNDSETSNNKQQATSNNKIKCITQSATGERVKQVVQHHTISSVKKKSNGEA